MARMLRNELGGILTFETPETKAGEAVQANRPWQEYLHSAPSQRRALHLHSTRHWPELLHRLEPGSPVVITLHDLSLITGGCCQPLDCEHFASGCAELCPRAYREPRYYRAQVRDALDRLSPVLVCPSEWTARMARQMLPEADIRLAPGGVEWPAEMPNKAQAKRRLGLPASARLVLFAAHGGLEAAYKAGSSWMSLWARIKAMEPAAVGFMAGGRETKRHGDLFLWPYLDRERMDHFLAAADVLVYPTLADTQGLVILEAMAQGTAVVASAVGGVSEQILDNHTGILVPGGDPLALADPAAKLLSHPLRAKRMGQAGHAWGLEHRSKQAMAARYKSIYDELVVRLAA